MKIACIQPSYIPWKGYFDIIHSVDHFVFYDDAQYPRGRDWRNRNQIIINGQLKWLTIPVSKSAWHLPINEVTIPHSYADEHWRLIEQAYRKTAKFPELKDVIKKTITHPETNLCNLTIFQTKELCRLLGIDTPLSLMSDLKITSQRKTDKLVAMCLQLGASEYISGPAARAYIEPEKFELAGITLKYFEYSYPPYPQKSEVFTHYVSILDMLFNLGDATPGFIWGNK